MGRMAIKLFGVQETEHTAGFPIGLKLVDTAEADEVYTREWALNTAAVTKLLLGD